MKKVHKNLKSANFTKPNGIVSAKVCAVTGKVATDKCTDTYTKYLHQVQFLLNVWTSGS